VIATLLLSPEPAFAVRCALAAAVGLAAWPVLRDCLGYPGERAVKALLWDARGAWWLTDRDGVCSQARLTRVFIFGPFVFLAFLNGESRPRRAMLDADGRDARAGRLLLGRLRLLPTGEPPAAC
jgi:hypothetical protein